jgi:lipopolysaccharide/colanic/teichoic acid biosynthesis glycosyltransferase
LKVLAILLDTRPAYLNGAASSALLAPLGPTTVLRFLAERLASADHRWLTIVTDFEPEPDYVQRVLDSGARVNAIVPARELAARIAECEPSDWLVMVDPHCGPARAPDAGALSVDHDGPPRVRHLVALEAHAGGTTERVQVGANGAVGRIQRYYDQATWPFTSGVACSLLPVSCMFDTGELSFASLRDLRYRLAERGVPSQDVFIGGGAFDLSQESDLLGLSERLVVEHFRRSRGSDDESWSDVGLGCQIDLSSRLVGPVILHDRVVIGPHATVVGPAVIGAGARVGREAMVAQCVIGPHALIAPGLTLRHRVVFGVVRESPPELRSAASYRPARVPTVDASEVHDQSRHGSRVYALVKAALDRSVAALGLLLLSPILLLIALLVKLESKGPVLYRDQREGEGGRPFECLKFRTMFVGAAAQQRELLAKNDVDGPQFKLARDPRVTRLGRTLRTFSLDELPQLINVLRLEMSLVGPRPSPFRENQMCIPWREGRLSVRPGITGLWQVCRQRRLQGDFHQWIHFDLLYVRHMSFLVDLKILVATVLSLAGQWPVPLSWIIAHGDPEHAEAPTFASPRPAPVHPVSRASADSKDGEREVSHLESI